ncbi:MAG: hypothetical protein BWY74_01647 [Firmicutes bacterium ADurb.Bin419]|nr:MAG: hypothetical protein BWY74_01647 [Firmicutes bacterium ADurb.Bin419]
MIYNSPWCTNHHMGLLFELLFLVVERIPSVNCGYFESFESPQIENIFFYLNGKFSCGGKYQCLGLVFFPIHQFTNRNGKCGGLSASGLRFNYNILLLQKRGYNHLLNFRRTCEIQHRDCFQQLIAQFIFVET